MSCSQISANEIDAIWFRIGKHRLTEGEFLTIARWAYHAMPSQHGPSATIRLFEYVYSERRPAAH